MFFFVDGNGVIFKIKQHFDFTVARILQITFDNAFFEVSVESKDMSIEMHPIGLIEFR